MCIDLRKFNAVTRKYSYPLSMIDGTLDSLGDKVKYLTTTDLLQGYFQVEFGEESKENSAFITHSGLYEFNVVRMGATGTPALFQRLMDLISRGLKKCFVLIYLDDIIVFSSTFELHLFPLEQAFNRPNSKSCT